MQLIEELAEKPPTNLPLHQRHRDNALTFTAHPLKYSESVATWDPLTEMRNRLDVQIMNKSAAMHEAFPRSLMQKLVLMPQDFALPSLLNGVIILFQRRDIFQALKFCLKVIHGITGPALVDQIKAASVL